MHFLPLPLPVPLLYTGLALASACASAPKPKPFAHVFSATELKADVAKLRASLEEGHAGLYRWRPKRVVDSIFKALEDSAATPMTALAFWRVTARALTALRDGHIAVFPGQAATPELFQRVIPLTLFVDADSMRLYVRRNLTGAAAIADGSEIVRLNGLTGAEFLRECLRYIPADAEITMRGMRRLTREFELTCAPAFGLPAEWTIVTRAADGRMDSVVAPAITFRERRQRLAQRAPADTVRPSLGELRWMRGDSVAVIALRTWTKQSDFKPDDFIDRSFEQLRGRNVCNLVIDLRGNTGGSDKSAGRLYRHIARDTFTYYRERVINKGRFQFLKGTGDWLLNWALPFYDKTRLPDGRYRLALDLDKPMRPERDAYRGAVTLLLDGDSFSTSSEFASVFRFHARGRIVGEDSPTPEVGGSGASAGFTLPNSGLEVSLPLVTITMPTRSARGGHGVAPDVRVRCDVQQLLAGNDPAMAAAARCP